MRVQQFVTSVYDRLIRDEAMTFSASLAFYTSLSLAPMLVLFVAITGHLSESMQEVFQTEVEALVGNDAGQAVGFVMENAKAHPDLGTASSVVGVVTLLLSASLVFGEMRAALNRVFERPAAITDKLSFFQLGLGFIKQRVANMGLALGFLFLTIVSLVFSSLVAGVVDADRAIWSAINIVLSVFSYVIAFALLFRYMPVGRTPWRQAVRGGLITAVLFVVGKELIGLYLGQSALGSSYGAAGSVIVLLAWVYYSAFITLIGAEISQIFAVRTV